MTDDPSPKPGDETEADDIADPAEDEAAGGDEDAEDGPAGDDEGEEGEDDGEGDDEEGDGAGDGDEAEEPPARAARTTGRANDTIRRLRRENQDLKRITGTRTSDARDPAQQQREYQAEQGRLLEAARERERMGEVGAVAQFLAEKQEREFNNRLQWQANQSFERDDRREFRALVREDRISADLQDYVEEHVATARANGNFLLTREAVLNHRLGEMARQRARNGGNKRQQDRGQARIVRQTVRTPRAGSDAVNTRRGGRTKDPANMSVEEFEQSFGDVPITGR